MADAVISISVYSTIRRSFEQADQDRANAVAAQFRSEFQRRGSDVARKVESVAASEAVQRIALDMNRGGADASEYVGEARSLAGQQRLDFLELVDTHGTILSSAQAIGDFVVLIHSLCNCVIVALCFCLGDDCVILFPSEWENDTNGTGPRKA